MPLRASFRDCYFRFEYLGSAWQSAKSEGHFMLELFPQWFPDHDYKPLRQRLDMALKRR
ncbi:hypothetical protein OIE66_17380 [Nonomuraea sp. NBC_01738]|uniref:hypothetical protein n=1 Tax=Nonomuraea sp. NBC_01738 TaxID=2976003 RepID=UPI002E15A972|nr:hypothetical protein OIE66_17380 [Nonomuraea sp. NBC_01738]